MYGAELDELADRLIRRAPQQIDAFTRNPLIPDHGLVYEQLIDGVDPDDVVYPRMIPINDRKRWSGRVLHHRLSR